MRVLEGRGRKVNRKAGKKTLKVQVPAADASRNGGGGERKGEGACTHSANELLDMSLLVAQHVSQATRGRSVDPVDLSQNGYGLMIMMIWTRLMTR